MNKKNHHVKEDFYVVQAIIGHRGSGANLEYKIKWKGYPESDSTWEPMTNLDTVKDLIQEYDRSISLTPKKFIKLSEGVGINNKIMNIQVLSDDDKYYGDVQPTKTKLRIPQTFSEASVLSQRLDESSETPIIISQKKKPENKTQVKEIQHNKSPIKKSNQTQQSKIQKLTPKQDQFLNKKQLKEVFSKNDASSKSTSKNSNYKSTQNPNSTPIVKQLAKKPVPPLNIEQTQKIKRINHVLIQNQKILYEVQYEHVKNKPVVQALAYEQIPLQFRQLVPKYYQKVLLLLNSQQSSKHE